MKIATYNIWNDESLPGRTEDLLREIVLCGADIIGLQEVPRAFYEAARGLYLHGAYEPYEGEDEGLALLSRFPILQSERLFGRADALHVLIEADGMFLSVTNAHLPWRSILQREEQIVFLEGFLQGVSADRQLLLGDFNGESDSVHGFLTGLRSLRGTESDPVWLDAAANFATLHGVAFAPTLDTISNPRWQGKNRAYAPKTMDRIYLRDSFSPFSFDDARLFGTKANAATGLCPSDHYGVLAEITFA
ncbi:MAG: endonuclease/exonuclease/phosphatase family protein [Eubacteriales bacterium]|nr:endonuclease/exonuclease/phosphatase family protein [Eubacteriales bacterium]